MFLQWIFWVNLFVSYFTLFCNFFWLNTLALRLRLEEIRVFFTEVWIWDKERNVFSFPTKFKLLKWILQWSYYLLQTLLWNWETGLPYILLESICKKMNLFSVNIIFVSLFWQIWRKNVNTLLTSANCCRYCRMHDCLCKNSVSQFLRIWR